MTAAEFAAVLGARRIGDGKWLAKCPSHPDESPSLSVRDAGDRVLIHCFGGCPASAVVRALDLTLADLFNDKPSRTRFTKRGKAPRAVRRKSDPAAALRAEVLARYRVQTFAEKLLADDPESEQGWDALGVAFRGLAEAVYRLNIAEGWPHLNDWRRRV